MEKEKYAGMRPSAYLGSKLAYLSVLVLVQSVWMFAFVDFFWDRGGGLTHLLFLILADAAMTFVCLGISSLARSADQASLLSIYLWASSFPFPERCWPFRNRWRASYGPSFRILGVVRQHLRPEI